MTILPYDIGGLRCFLDFYLVVKKGLEVTILVILHCFIIKKGSIEPFFCLTRNENRARGLHQIEHLLVVSKVVDYVLVDVIKLGIVFVLDGFASGVELADDLRICISKCDHCDFDFTYVAFHALVAQSWELSESILHFIFEE